MYDIYGIVKVEYYSCNKSEYFVYIGHVISLLKRNPKWVLWTAVHLI